MPRYSRREAFERPLIKYVWRVRVEARNAKYPHGYIVGTPEFSKSEDAMEFARLCRLHGATHAVPYNVFEGS